MEMDHKQEEDLIFGLLAVRMKKLDEDSLQGALTRADNMQTLDLGRHLVETGAISEADCAQVRARQAQAIREHGGDLDATLTAMGGIPALTATFGDSLPLPAPSEDWPKTQGSAGPMSSAATIPSAPGAFTGATVAKRQSPVAGDEIPVVREHAGRYKEIKTYASGGMGRILLVSDEHIGRDVALKELLPDQLSSLGTHTGAPPTSEMLTIPALARFVQEAKVTGQLEHPNIVPVYELGYRLDGRLYYTMRFVRGKTLQEALSECTSLSDRLKLLTHFLDLCHAMSYAHSRGVIHRDIKPRNVMVGEFGETVVIDWGIAKARGRQDLHARDIAENVEALRSVTEESTVKTVYGQALGSPHFMPPEQAKGLIDQIDERSDVYSLGAVLFTILTGQVPYLGCGVREFLRKVTEEPPQSIRALAPEAPPELIAICERAMQRDPKDRYDSAKELAEEVHRFVSGGLVRAYTYSMRELIGRFVRKHRTFLVTAGLSLLVLIAVSVFSYIRVVHEKEVAVEQRRLAVIAKNQAVKAREEEEVAKKRAERELYSSNIALAERCLTERRLDQARTLLATCPENYRGWEWGRLVYLCNADRMTLKAGGQFAAFAGPDQLLTVSVDGTLVSADLAKGALDTPWIEKAGYGAPALVSANGERLALAGDTSVSVWDAATGKAVFTANDLPKPDGWARTIAFSGSGTRLAVRTDAKTITVWDLATQAVTATLPLERNMGFAMALSPDGSRLLTGAAVMGAEGMQNALVLRDAATGQEISSHAIPAPPFIHAVVFSPDETRAAAGTDTALTVFDLDAWTSRATFDVPIYYPGSIAFSPDGACVAAVGRDDGMLTVWDIAANTSRFRVKAHLDITHAVTFSPDGQRLATASSDRTAKLWDAMDGRLLKEIRGHNAAVFHAAFSPDGTRLATSGYDGCTKIWAVDNALEWTAFDAIAVASTRGQLAASNGERLALWNLHSGRVLHELDTGSGRIARLAFDPEGKRLASASPAADGTATIAIRLWNPASGANDATVTTPLTAIEHLAFSPDGACLAARGGSSLILIDPASASIIRTIEDVHGFLFRPGTPEIAIGKQDGSLRIEPRDSATPRVQFKIVTKTDLCLAFSPDGQQFLAGDDEVDDAYTGAVRIWNAESGDAMATLKGHLQSVTCITFDAQGKHIATGSKDAKIMLWDAAAYTPLLTLAGHAGDIRGLLFNDTGTRVISACNDGTFKLWNAEDGRELITLHDAALRTEAKPRFAAFAEEGRQLIVATEPQVLPPAVLNRFPFTLGEYPGTPETPLQDRIETYKRAYWGQ